MKKYRKLNSVSYREYKHTDFKEVFSVFVAFQKKNQIKQYHNLSHGQSENFYLRFLFYEIKKLIERCPIKYVSINEKTGKICGFACFTEGGFVPNHLDLQLVIKDPDYTLSKPIILCFFTVLLKVKKKYNKRIYAVLGDRERFSTYMKAVQRIFKAKIISKDSLNRYLVEFLP
jgi:hypothetical protein